MLVNFFGRFILGNGSFSPANLAEVFPVIPMISSIGLKCVPKNTLSLKLWSGIVCLDISLRFVTACIFLKLLKRARFFLESACSKKSFYIILSSSARQHMSATAPHSAKWCQQRIHTNTFDYRWAQRDSKKFNAV